MKILHSILDFLASISDSLVGAFMYFIYGHVYLKKSFVKGVIGFIVGSSVSIYGTPELAVYLPMNTSFLAFALGLLGMKITEAIAGLNYGEILEGWLSSKGIDTHRDDLDESNKKHSKDDSDET